MTLVTSDDRQSPRIMPKVFSDVPSQAEIEAAKAQTARLLVMTIFLAGLLVAAALACVVLWLQNGQLQRAPTDLKTQLEKSAGQTTALKNQLAMEQKHHSDELLAVQRERDQLFQAYDDVEMRRAETQEVRDRIAALLSGDKKGAENDRRVRLALAPYFSEPKWEQVKRNALPVLEGETKALENAERAVKSWIRPSNPRDSGVSPFGH